MLFSKFKYIPNIINLNLQCIIIFIIDNELGSDEMLLFNNNVNFLSNLVELDLSCIFKYI